MVARVNTVAFQGIEAVGIDVQVESRRGFPLSPSSACRTKRAPNRGSGSARPSARLASPFPQNESRSISPRRFAQGRQPFRSADRDRLAGQSRRSAGGRDHPLNGAGRIGPRWGDHRGFRGVARRTFGFGAKPRHHLPASLRVRGGLGGRDRGSGAGLAAFPRQSFQGYAEFVATRPQNRRRKFEQPRSSRYQGPRNRQARPRDCRGRRA